MCEKQELYFIPHCDSLGCDLGTAEFICPVCLKINIDYDVLWWNQYKLFDTELATECECCKEILIAYWDTEEMQTMVKKYING